LVAAGALNERLAQFGLISKEYDGDRGRLIGDFPQAFTHLALVQTAGRLDQNATSPVASAA
jgi:GH15 family glucan-1,4-alpha-glucosidase